MNERRIKLRTVVLALFFILVFGMLLFRLLWIQGVNAQSLLQKAQVQWERNDIIQPQRGTVFDRNGELLAYTSKAYTVIAKLKALNKSDENYVDNALETGRQLAAILDMPADRIAKLIEDSKSADRGQVELRPGGWKISEDKAKEILELDLPGLILFPETKRYYPNDAFAAHVIGYTDLDGRANMGIEKVFDERLQGEPGKLQVMEDNKGFKLPAGMEDIIPARDGDNIYLTIDYQIQNYVEDALNSITEKYKAKGISVIVGDPHTGEILAMANRPHFSPNNYQDITNWTNLAVSSTFEPGSTFKIVTLAAAVEEGHYRDDITYMSGTYRNIPGPPIHDHNRGQGWGTISYLRGVQESSNVLFTILGYERLGKDKFYQYLERFGFGEQTKIGLAGEASAELRDKDRLYPRDIASMTFGQGVVVTAIQQVAAVSAVANGGELVQPRIVKEIRNSQSGEVLERHDKSVVRRVVSEETSKQVSDILETVVTKGTGQAYNLEGYHVAGKTGTAQVVGKNGQYQANKHIYSFVGYAPKDDPEFLVYVMVDQPEIGSSGGGGRNIVAPIFKHVMENSLQYKKVSPDISEETLSAEAEVDLISIPDLSGKSPVAAEELLKQQKIRVKVIGTGSKIVGQYPRPEEEVMSGSVLYAITDKITKDYLPDFTGQTLREVMEYCSLMGISLKPEGKGYAVSQSIPPGAMVSQGDQLTVQLKSDFPSDESSETTVESDKQRNDDE